MREEVEKALAEVSEILAGWSFHAGFPSQEGLAALDTIRAELERLGQDARHGASYPYRQGGSGQGDSRGPGQAGTAAGKEYPLLVE